jgi:hypothetical protein
MAAAKETKGTALVATPDRSRLGALVGTIEERIRAFDQIAANLASLQLNGWDTVQRIKAACWLSDGAGMHPATFVQNHYCMTVQEKLIVEPKMEFILGVLQSRIPGFRFVIEEEEDDHAKVWMTDGKSEVRKSYDLDDARRLGLFSRRGNMLTGGATREWCLKQAVKKAGRMIGAAALMDLPVGLDTYEIADGAAPAPTPTEAIDAAIEKATGKPVDVEFEEESAGDDTPRSSGARSEAQSPAPAVGSERAAAPAFKNPRIRLAKLMFERFGNLSKAETAAKVSELYNAMMQVRTGVPHEGTAKIGPIEAEQLIAYIEGLGGSKTADAPMATSSAGPQPPEAEAPEPEREANDRTTADAYIELMGTVLRARKLFGRKFVQEAPEGSGKYWFVDLATFSQAGEAASVKLQVGPDVVAPIEKIEQLNRILGAACDFKERGGR